MLFKVFWFLGIFHLFLCLSIGSCDKNDTARDCIDLLKKGFKGDGVYLINPDSNGSFQVYCDQTTNGGGWIVFQKRFNGSVDFYRNWSDYKIGFGDFNGEFWLGNDNIYRLTNRHHQLLVQLEDFDNFTAHALYEAFTVDSEENGYRLNLGAYSGTAGDSLSNSENMKFSTKDQDNDRNLADGFSCAQGHYGAWWYRNCKHANLNGNYFKQKGVSWRHLKGYDYSLKSTSMQIRSITGIDWDYSINLYTNMTVARAQLVVKVSLNQLTVCWWTRLLTSEDTRNFTVFSLEEASMNRTFAFSIQRNSIFRLTFNTTHNDFYLPEVNIHDKHWHHMCLNGTFLTGDWELYVDGVLRLLTTGPHSNMTMQPGSILRIGVSSAIRDDENELIGELSLLNIWDTIPTTHHIFLMSRGCHAYMGNVIPWSVVQLWLHENVTKTTPSSCTSADNIHWTLSSIADGKITDDSYSYHGHVVGDGVSLDSKVLSLQGGGHVILGSFEKFCPGIPSMCLHDYSVGFWVKHGVKFTSYILGQNEKYHAALESMVSAVTPNNSKWTRCFHAKSDGFTAHDFHSRCDNKGPTVTLVQVREYVFGGFLDQNWGGPKPRLIRSTSAFLFSLNNVLGLNPFTMDVFNESYAAVHDPTEGPRFGLDDLRIDFDSGLFVPRLSSSVLGGVYSLPERYNKSDVDKFRLLAGTKLFTWDDLEVFYYDIPHRPLGVGDPSVILDSAFTATSNSIPLNYSAAKAFTPEGEEGEWCAYYNDDQQWIQAKLNYSNNANFWRPGIKVTIFGAYSEESRVKSAQIDTSTDGKNWTTFTAKIWENDFLVRSRPVYLRLIPKSWESNICMKIEIRLQSQRVISVHEMTASSTRCMSPPHFGRLHFSGACFSAWCSKTVSHDKYPSLTVNLGAAYYILFVATQGADNEQNKHFALLYVLHYLLDKDENSWEIYKEKGRRKIFQGNWDGSTAVKNAILEPFKTHKLKFLPSYYHEGDSVGVCLRVEIYVPADDQDTIISWRTKGTADKNNKREFEYKQVNELFTSYHQLSVAWGKKIQTLNVPTIPREWHYVTFTWSNSWDLKVYQNGVLVNETGRALVQDYSDASATDGLLIIGKRSLFSHVKPADNIQIHGLTVWPRLISQAQIREMLETVDCRMSNWCLNNSNEDRFDWLYGTDCTTTPYTGPCSDPHYTNQVQRLLTNGAFNRKTEQLPNGSSWLAVDGIFSTDAEVGQGFSPWWKVTLSQEGLVIGVRLNLDATDRMVIRIKVINSNDRIKLCSPIDVSGRVYDEYVTAYCDKPLLGRYVKLLMDLPSQVPKDEFKMYLREVDVMLDQYTGFVYLEASDQYKGDMARLDTRYILPTYNCMTFSYHMDGRQMGKLSVFSKRYQGEETLLWRLFGKQSNEWQQGEIPINSTDVFKIIFEGTIGGPEGDAAIDDVKFTRSNHCSLIPDIARPASGDFRSAIIGHIPAYKARLEGWLTSVDYRGKLWKPCYSGAKDGWDSGIFHEKCDGKGATLTIARVDNTIFGGFTDQSWGSSLLRQISTKSFLFRFERTLGQAFEDLVLGIGKKLKHIQWSEEQGPIFGFEELALSSNMREARTSKLVFYAENTTNETFLMKENNTYLHDIEVLVIGDTACTSPCPLYQYCDEIEGKCAWDLNFVDARFCDPGTPSSYWPLDNHTNMVNLGGDQWGTFNGTVGTVRGARLGAVNTGSDAVINLGRVTDICFTDPLFCDSGFTVSLWLTHRTTYLSDAIIKQEFITIGDSDSREVTFNLFQQEGRTGEHLAVNVSASSRSCFYAFSVPRNLWSHYAFVWNTTQINVYRNGRIVNKFLNKERFCVEKTQTPSQLPLVTLKGAAIFDDLKIWNKTLQLNEIEEMYSCVRGPSWTCKTSNWSESLKTNGWSRCSEDNYLMNGLQRGEFDRLEGAWCCSAPSIYKQKDWLCYTEKINHRKNFDVIRCGSYHYLRGFLLLTGSQAPVIHLTHGECCRLAEDPPWHYACYYQSVSPFDKPGLFKCKDQYYITEIHTRGCSQLQCVDKFRCCKMKTDARTKRDVEISVTALLVGENWHEELKQESTNEFKMLKYRIQMGVMDVYEKARKRDLVKGLRVLKFRRGSVIAHFSIVFYLPYYEIISTLIDSINQTVSQHETNYLWDLPIKLLDVQPVNVHGKSLNIDVTTINSSTFYLNWESVEEIPDYGFFQGYQLLYKKGYMEGDHILSTEINDNITQVWFTVDECEMYSFKVRAFSLDGYGKLSDAVTVGTSCKVLSNVSATALNSSSIFIQWSPTKGSRLVGYNVTYTKEPDGATLYKTLERRVSKTQCYLMNLPGLTTYRISVGLMSNESKTAWSEEVFATTLERAPTAAPENVTAHNLSSTSVMVRWLPVPDDLLNGVLQSYQVLYRQASEGSSPPMEIVVGNESLSVVISSLMKFTVYSVWVKAVTLAEGPNSAVVNVSTDEDVPSLSPVGVTAFNISSTIIRVLWQPIPTDRIHGVLLGYRVEYHKVRRAKRSVTMVLVNESSLSVDIRELLKFSEYRIMVSGFNNKGDGNQSEIRCWTDEDTPDSPPTNITTRTNTSTSIDVFWNPVIHEDQNGLITGYRVSLFDAWGTALRNVTVMNSTPSFYQFQGLEVWTNYSVKVCAFTSKGNGPYSSSLLAKTDEGVPLVAPTKITGHNTSSTSIQVTWQPVSSNDVNIRGIHRGYRVYYKAVDTPRPSVLMNVTVDVHTTHAQLTNLYKFTNYSIYVVVMTRWDGLRSPVISVSTDEGTPDLPPVDITARTLGMRGIRVHWAPVPLGFRGGIIRGYKISYSSDIFTTRLINASHDASHVTLTSLKKFTFYDVYVRAFTIKGDGPAYHLSTATDMGVPTVAPPGLKAEDWGTTHSIIVKWQSLPPSNEYGILSGYHVRYRLAKIGERITTDQPEKEFNVDPKTNQVLLENLEMYGTYRIWVSAFTVKGNGPESFTYGDTCRCEKHLRTNWRMLQPYVSKGNMSNVDAPHPGGILPGIIQEMAVTCCQTCKSHGQSLVDFKLDGNDQPSQKSSDSALRSSISHKTHLSFPIPGYTGQVRFGVDFGYWPLIQTPGVAYIVNTNNGYSPSSALNDTLISCLPVVLLVFVMSLLAGFFVWILDSRANPNQFPASVTRGPVEGFWWAFITMTTVGYGDKYAVTPGARFFTGIWMITGLILQGTFVATVTMSLVSQSLDVDFKLYGSKTGAIQDSFEYRFGLRRNALLNPDKQFTSYDDISEALLNGDVTGALIDTYVLGSRKDLFEKPSLRIIDIYDYSTAYGVVLGGESRKLRQCFGRYMQSHRMNIFQTVKSHVDFVEESPIPLAVERSTGLFDSETSMYKSTMVVSSVLFLALLVVGAMSELGIRLKRRRRVQTESDIRPNTRREMIKEVDDFAAEIKALVENLKAKHSKERLLHLKALKSRSAKMELYRTACQ